MENNGTPLRIDPLAGKSLPRMITEKQAAWMLSVSVAALRRWRREHRGPQFTRLERCIRYDLRVIELYLLDNSSQKKAADSHSAANWEGRI